MSSPPSEGPAPDSDGVTFNVRDEGDRLAAVTLHQELMRPRRGPPFTRAPGARTWTVRLGRPPADRMEYRLEIKEHSSRIQVMCDPANPLRTPGPFGDKSVVQWPEYRPPRWLERDGPVAGTTRRIAISSRALAATFDVVVWTSLGGSRSGMWNFAVQLEFLVEATSERDALDKAMRWRDAVSGHALNPVTRATEPGALDALDFEWHLLRRRLTSLLSPP